ncbi:MAG: NAD-dependent dehydratase, partial [Chloroflexi bacterium]
MNMRVLVLGGTRFMGPHIVRQLLMDGHQVTLFHRGVTDTDPLPGAERIHGDRTRLPEYREQFAALAPEVVLDTWAMTARDGELLVETLRGITERVVILSSIDTFRAYGRFVGSEPGDILPTPLTEDSPLRERLYPYRGEQPRAADDPLRWFDDYDKNAVAAAARKQSDLPVTILRLPMTYGPGDRQHRLYPYLTRMDAGREVILLDAGSAGWRSTWGYVENVAAGIALATTDQRAAGRDYIICDDGAPTLRQWVEAIGVAAGWTGRVVELPVERMPAHLQPMGNVAQDLLASSARIRSELGFREPVSFEEGMR